MEVFDHDEEDLEQADGRGIIQQALPFHQCDNVLGPTACSNIRTGSLPKHGQSAHENTTEWCGLLDTKKAAYERPQQSTWLSYHMPIACTDA